MVVVQFSGIILLVLNQVSKIFIVVLFAGTADVLQDFQERCGITTGRGESGRY